MKTELGFDFLKNGKKKEGYFLVENLNVESTGISYDSVAFFLSHNRYQGELYTFENLTLSEDALFEIVTNVYLRGDRKEYLNIRGDWDIFQPLEREKRKEQNLTTILPMLVNRDLQKMELVLATNEFFYYQNKENICLMLNKQGEIITNVEDFYKSALYDSVVEYLKDEQTVKYIDSELKDAIEKGDYEIEEEDLREYES